MDIRNILYGSKHEPKFFRKDEEGKDVFYPWGYPGESFYINEKQKRKTAIFCYIFGFLFILFSMSPLFAASDYKIEIYTAFCLLTIVLIVFPLVYFCYMYFLIKKLQPYIPKTKATPVNTIYALLVLLFSQILFTALGVYISSSPLAAGGLVLLNGSYVLALIFLIILTFRTKGYYFTYRYGLSGGNVEK